MAKKKQEPVDNLLDALVWMRRKAKKHEAVDDLVDALVKMRSKRNPQIERNPRVEQHSFRSSRRVVKKSAVQHKRLNGRDVRVTDFRLCTGLCTEIVDRWKPQWE
jgi:hypothetical protein